MRTTLALILSSAVPVMAEDFFLVQPIDCILGENCFIQQYVDRDPGPGALDFTCGPLSYDGHKGTDFALYDLQSMENGVNVLASAKGVVSGLRDGEPDTGMTNAAPGKDCGNGVAVRHKNGWVTQYCHLKKGSVAIEIGQTLAAGDVIGQVGLSGRTEFPHVHISVRHNDTVIDPFDPAPQEACGTDTPQTLWSTDITYRPGGLISVGISDAVPLFADVKSGRVPHMEPTPRTQALVLYAHLFGTREGDVLTMRLDGPRETIVEHDLVLEKTQARSFRAAGRKRPDTGWATGKYKGTVALWRDQQKISNLDIEFEVQ